MKHTRKLLILIGGFLPLFLFSQNKIADDALAAADFMASFTKKTVTVESVNTLENNNQKLYIFQISGGGWVMMDAMNSKVIGFNDKGVFDVQKSPLFGESKLMAVQTPLQVTSSIVNNANKSVADGDTVYPFFTDTWGGTNQWDSNNNVVHSANYYTPEFCSPGCVAIATAQILNYYEWPNIGEVIISTRIISTAILCVIKHFLTIPNTIGAICLTSIKELPLRQHSNKP